MSESKRKIKRKPIYVGERNVFDVDCILKRRIVGSKTEYLIKWLGYDDNENSWVDELDVTPDLIKSFDSMIQSTELRRRRQVTSTAQTLNAQGESLPSPPPSPVQNNDSYFEEGLHNFGLNVQLLSTTDDVQLFSSPKCGHDPNSSTNANRSRNEV